MGRRGHILTVPILQVNSHVTARLPNKVSHKQSVMDMCVYQVED